MPYVELVVIPCSAVSFPIKKINCHLVLRAVPLKSVWRGGGGGGGGGGKG